MSCWQFFSVFQLQYSNFIMNSNMACWSMRFSKSKSAMSRTWLLVFDDEALSSVHLYHSSLWSKFGYFSGAFVPRGRCRLDFFCSSAQGRVGWRCSATIFVFASITTPATTKVAKFIVAFLSRAPRGSGHCTHVCTFEDFFSQM